MNVPQEELIGAGVYDSSRGTSDSNWKWSNVTNVTNVKIDRAWEGVAALIHQGWPADKEAFSDRQAFLNEKAAMLGMIRGRDSFWLYRVYPAGRDRDRPGRYIFVVLRLSSLEQVLDPRVAGLLAYFEEERGFPLNTSPLERQWPEKEVDMNLSNLLRECEVMPIESHWGVDGNGRVLHFRYVPWEAEAQKEHRGHRVRNFVCVAGASIAALGVALKSRPSGDEHDPPKKSMPDKLIPEPEDMEPPDRATAQPGTDDDAGKVHVQSGATIQMKDNQGCVEVKSKDGSKDGSKEVTIRDPQDQITWSGPWDTAQDKAAAPPDVRQRVENLNIDNDFGGDELRLHLRQTPPPDAPGN